MMVPVVNPYFVFDFLFLPGLKPKMHVILDITALGSPLVSWGASSPLSLWAFVWLLPLSIRDPTWHLIQLQYTSLNMSGELLIGDFRVTLWLFLPFLLFILQASVVCYHQRVLSWDCSSEGPFLYPIKLQLHHFRSFSLIFWIIFYRL